MKTKKSRNRSEQQRTADKQRGKNYDFLLRAIIHIIKKKLQEQADSLGPEKLCGTIALRAVIENQPCQKNNGDEETSKNHHGNFRKSVSFSERHLKSVFPKVQNSGGN